MGIKKRQLLETELALVQHQRRSGQVKWVEPEVMRGAEDAINWVLAGRTSPAPLSNQRLDPTNAAHVRRESEVAEEVWFGRFAGRGLSPAATGGNVAQYAHGVSRTLGWACGASEVDAMGRDDEDLVEVAEELRLEVSGGGRLRHWLASRRPT